MKDIYGYRKALEESIVKLLMSDASDETIDAALNKLRPAGRLRLANSISISHLKPRLLLQTLHRPGTDKT